MSKPFGHDIKQRTFIVVTPEKVYDTITSGDGWNAFFTHATEIDPKPVGFWFVYAVRRPHVAKNVSYYPLDIRLNYALYAFVGIGMTG